MIRAIEEADFAAILELFREFAEFQGQSDRMRNTLVDMKRDRDLLNGFVFVNDDGLIVGYATIFFCYYTWTGKSLYLDDLYVRPTHRGNGIGTALIQHVIGFAKEHQCRQLRWQVSNWNTSAIRFYQSLGAKVDGVEQNCLLRFED